MGPQSKEEICNALGFLIEALTLTNATLSRIEAKLTRRSEEENEDMQQVNRRLLELERWRNQSGANGAAPPPAE
jgi:hypothetical protein